MVAVAPSPQAALVEAFARLPVTRNLVAQLRRGAHVKAGGLWGAAAALPLTVMRTAQKKDQTLLILTADDVDSLQLQTDLLAFGTRSHVLIREEEGDDGEVDATTRSARQRTMQQFAADGAPLIASIEAMLQPIATPRGLRKSQLELTVGQQLDRTQILQRAQAAGMRSVPLVLAPGSMGRTSRTVPAPRARKWKMPLSSAGPRSHPRRMSWRRSEPLRVAPVLCSTLSAATVRTARLI